eukprot:m.4451 g.4451  ORF g.4451 m.4451 type:complete len:117 (+) comp4491_c0_seq2:80-430(+)
MSTRLRLGAAVLLCACVFLVLVHKRLNAHPTPIYNIQFDTPPSQLVKPGMAQLYAFSKNQQQQNGSTHNHTTKRTLSQPPQSPPSHTESFSIYVIAHSIEHGRDDTKNYSPNMAWT